MGEPASTDAVASVIHELKAPLAAMSGQIQLARRLMAKDPARSRAAIDIALEQGERLTHRIVDLQEQLRLQADAVTRDVVTFDVCESVESSIRRHEHGEMARFRFDRPTHRIRVRADPERVAQILDNLLNNAVKYSPADAPIDVAVATIGDQAHVHVEDYGIGVAAEERDRMFMAYYRTSRTRDIAGSGLGLYISRRLAEQNGGRLWLDDSTDSGSVFALALPLAT
jgi:signal transduction histidine kinase